MIQVRDLSYTYPGSKIPALKSLNFDLKKGEILGFLGPSGAGKSSTQKILIRLLRSYAGTIEVMGRPLRQWTNEYYNYIGVGFELPNHYLKLTALENLQLIASFYDRPTLAAHKLLEMVGLSAAASQRVGRFSKGMKMRLNFVRALLHQPDLLFLDEPTAGLDPVNARMLKDMMLALKNQGKTIFLTTHNMHDAEELCDRVAFIVDGQIIALDTPQMFKQKGSLRQLKVEYQQEGLQSALFPLEGIGNNPDFLSLIRSIEPQSMHTHEPSLEDIFIQITGKRLRSNRLT